MCTVTYFPYEDGCILTSNRDEHVSRKPSSLPEIERFGENLIMFPVDMEAFGSWIMASDQGRLVCLLNGAFELHERKAPYRMSRGIVVKESFNYPSAESFYLQYDLDQIEPFTLVWIEFSEALELYEFRWDGEQKHFKSLDPDQFHIWSSATLYTAKQRALRDKWFNDWFDEDEQVDSIKILDFHDSAGEGDENTNLRMKRAMGVETVSTTQVVTTQGTFRMFHRSYRDDIAGSNQLKFHQSNPALKSVTDA